MDSKKRAANFSSVEESLLVDLVKKYRDIIECKKSDTNSLRMKTETWIKIAKEFNSRGEVYREAKILKSKYDNLKKRAKSKFAEEKMYRCSTGGGPSQDFKIEQIDDTIKELIGTQITGFTSNFDDDSEIVITETPVMVDDERIEIQVTDNQSAAPSAISKDHCYIDENVINDNRFGASTSSVAVDHCYIEEKKKSDWSKYTPQLLRTPKSAPLQTTDFTGNQGKRLPFIKNPLSRKMVTWAESKVELAELQKKCYLEQHQLKMRLMQEEHEERLKLLHKESEVRIEIMKQTKNLNM